MSSMALGIGEGQRVGSYRVVRFIGAGGMGAVYEAVHTQIRKRAAIKFLYPQGQPGKESAERAQRFLNEARAVNIVADPGLVEVFEHGQLPDRTAYIVMEYLEGETLKARLMQAGKLPYKEAMRLVRQVADTLAATHRKGIVHRDLKPDNVMIVPDSQVEHGERTKVLDFGIAKVAIELEEAETQHTATGAIMGTPTYMSPEQCLSAGKVDFRTDVYSLGVMLYQMLTGRLPFVAESRGALMLMHMTQLPPPLHKIARDVPDVVAELVHRMLAKKKELRPSMAEVAVLAEQIETGRLRPRSPRRLVLVAAALLVLGGAGTGLLWRQHRKPQVAAKLPSPLPVPPPVTAPPTVPDQALIVAAPAPVLHAKAHAPHRVRPEAKAAQESGVPPAQHKESDEERLRISNRNPFGE